MSVKVGSLFSGIGGLDIAIEAHGYEVAWQVEYDDFCNKVLAKHWPEVTRYGDIRAVDYAHVERVDGIIGGFPCTPFSVAGKQRGVNDDRYMWPDFLDAIEALRPKWIFIENVPGLLMGGQSIARTDNERIRRRVDRWRRLHLNQQPQEEWEEILRASRGYWDDRKSPADFEQDGSTFWWQGLPAPGRDNQMGSSIQLAYLWGRCGVIPGEDISLFGTQDAAGNEGPRDAEHASGERWMDAADARQSRRTKAANPRTQPQGATAVARNSRKRDGSVARGAVGSSADEHVSAMATLLGDLAEAGYDAEWCTLRASDIGAPHRRERLFILAYAQVTGVAENSYQWREPQPHDRTAVRDRDSTDGRTDVGYTKPSGLQGRSGLAGTKVSTSRCSDVADSSSIRWPDGSQQRTGRADSGGQDIAQGEGIRDRRRECESAGLGSSADVGAMADANDSDSEAQRSFTSTGNAPRPHDSSRHVADADQQGLEGWGISPHSARERATRTSSPQPWPPSPNDTEGWARLLTQMPEVEPAVCRDAYVVPDRAHRLKALGNAVVWPQAAMAFEILRGRIQ